MNVDESGLRIWLFSDSKRVSVRFRPFEMGDQPYPGFLREMERSDDWRRGKGVLLSVSRYADFENRRMRRRLTSAQALLKR